MSNCTTDQYVSCTGHRHGRVEYSRDESESPTVAVVRALARYHDDDATAVRPILYDVVDPDALDALFADRDDGTPRGRGTVRFQVEDLQVVVRPESVRVESAARES